MGFLHLPFQQTDRADIERCGEDQLAPGKKRQFGAAAANIDIKVGMFFVHVLGHMVLVNEGGLAAAADDLDDNPGLGLDTIDDGLGIYRVPHRGGCRRLYMPNTVGLRQMPVRLDRMKDHVGLFGRDLLSFKYIKTQPQGHPDQVDLVEFHLAVVEGRIRDQQPCRVTPDIDSCQSHRFLWFDRFNALLRSRVRCWLGSGVSFLLHEAPCDTDNYKSRSGTLLSLPGCPSCICSATRCPATWPSHYPRAGYPEFYSAHAGWSHPGWDR